MITFVIGNQFSFTHMNKEEIIKQFNPNAAATADAGIYGLPFGAEHSDVVLVAVPWEVTVSSGSGTAEGPDAINEASMQVDLYNHDYPELWKKGIHLDLSFPQELQSKMMKAKDFAQEIIFAIEEGENISDNAVLSKKLNEVNDSCNQMNLWVKEQSEHWLAKGKKLGLVGGDHSIPLGYLQLQGEKHSDFGILHIDAHMDLRNAYEGFTYSHASIFYNVLQTVPQVSSLVQVGIRDYCLQEKEYAGNQGPRVSVYFDREIRKRMYSGENWNQLCLEMVERLPAKVYISVDIDGLDPKLCPNTGTPVPGGLEYEELVHLLNVLKNSGKEIIGFDLCEVAPGDEAAGNGDWDGNVGARILYQLCGTIAG
jgi:agmatinase